MMPDAIDHTYNDPGGNIKAGSQSEELNERSFTASTIGYIVF